MWDYYKVLKLKSEDRLKLLRFGFLIFFALNNISCKVVNDFTRSHFNISDKANNKMSAPLSPEVQVAAAVLPLPKELRVGASVEVLDLEGKMKLLKKGNNGMICIPFLVHS